MKVSRLDILEEVIIIEPDVYEDNRGYFLETFQHERYRGAGIPEVFVQDNMSFSKHGVLRGLHYQLGRPQGKLVSVAFGEIFDVAVDIRKGSSTFGKWVGYTISSISPQFIYIPEGFAHGFCVMSESAVMIYKCTDYYSPKDERGIKWDDPLSGINWPINVPILSEKDSRYPTIDKIGDADLPELDRGTVLKD